MALHMSGKLTIVAVVLVALITAFNTPASIDVSIEPSVSFTEIIIPKPEPVIAEDAPFAGPEVSLVKRVK